MAIKCGKCKESHDTVAEVRACYSALPDATVTTDDAGTTQVDRSGENFFLTEINQNLYDHHEDEMARQQEEVHQDRMNELFGEHPGHRKDDLSVSHIPPARQTNDWVPSEAYPTKPRPVLQTVPLYLDVPFAEKDQAKALGAKWGPANGLPEKRWYVPAGVNPAPLSRWIPPVGTGRAGVSIADPGPTQPRPELADGMYRKDGVIYKVQHAVNGSGNQYAKELKVRVRGGDAEVWFEYAPGMVGRLRDEHKMCLEEAKQFGALYGTCCVCGRTLTNEESIAEGIGPVCRGKF